MAELPVKQLRGLYFAELHIREALVGCKHLSSLKQDDTGLDHCIYTGIAVSYARPFKQNDGISKIGSEFHSFTDSKLGIIHKEVLEARDKIYAHFDMIHAGKKLAPVIATEKFEEIEIHIAESGSTHWILKRLGLPLPYLDQIATLCEFQISRIQIASKEMLGRFLGDKHFSPGKYVLGKDFP